MERYGNYSRIESAETRALFAELEELRENKELLVKSKNKIDWETLTVINNINQNIDKIQRELKKRGGMISGEAQEH